MRKCYFSGQRHRDFTPHFIPLQLDTSSRMWPTKQTPGKWDMSPKCHQTTGEPTTQGIILNMFLVEYMTPGGETCNSRMGYHWIKKNAQISDNAVPGLGCLGCVSSRKCKTVYSIVFQHSSRKWRREIVAVPVSFTTIFHPKW